jgi:nicotinate-nucleotide pyrophosphorylase (carboxylating)
MGNQFEQIVWGGDARRRLAAILELAVAEDLGIRGDVTSLALADAKAEGRAALVARREGVAAGLAGVEQILAAFEPRLQWAPAASDGEAASPGQVVGEISGPVRGILAAERTLLNVLGRLSGIATLTHRYVEAVTGTTARIYDTRKTAPGWRLLEKYAVRCGGGWNRWPPGTRKARPSTAPRYVLPRCVWPCSARPKRARWCWPRWKAPPST